MWAFHSKPSPYLNFYIRYSVWIIGKGFPGVKYNTPSGSYRETKLEKFFTALYLKTINGVLEKGLNRPSVATILSFFENDGGFP